MPDRAVTTPRTDSSGRFFGEHGVVLPRCGEAVLFVAFRGKRCFIVPEFRRPPIVWPLHGTAVNFDEVFAYARTYDPSRPATHPSLRHSFFDATLAVIACNILGVVLLWFASAAVAPLIEPVVGAWKGQPPPWIMTTARWRDEDPCASARLLVEFTGDRNVTIDLLGRRDRGRWEVKVELDLAVAPEDRQLTYITWRNDRSIENVLYVDSPDRRPVVKALRPLAGDRTAFSLRVDRARGLLESTGGDFDASGDGVFVLETCNVSAATGDGVTVVQTADKVFTVSLPVAPRGAATSRGAYAREVRRGPARRHERSEGHGTHRGIRGSR